MTNYEWLLSMPQPVLAQWLCDINKCDHCYFKDLKDQDRPGSCTWQWLNQTVEEINDEGSEQDR